MNALHRDVHDLVFQQTVTLTADQFAALPAFDKDAPVGTTARFGHDVVTRVGEFAWQFKTVNLK
jgi:hypothetical protein